ncbi:TonB-dependent receptor [Methylophilus sp. 13]|nr:TonB-dependent receptor [Methylophilus sp. 13]
MQKVLTHMKNKTLSGYTTPHWLALGVSLALSAWHAQAETLNVSLPKKSYQIPAGDLSDTLPDYAAESGILLGFDPILTQGKRSPALKGQYGVQEGFEALLKDSGLEVVQDKSGRYQLRRAAPKAKPIPGAPEKEDKALKLEGIEVRAKRFYEVGPLPGLGLTKEEIPGNVQSISAKEIKEAHSLSITDLMNRKLQSVTVNDYQGNPFQMDVQYRGFTAGPQIGTPQGLSVFIDGIRVNEPFGDIVNWDMIPMNALASVDVFPGSNPIFGLNTLGGAFSLKTKDGFNNAGADAEVLTGSFGRKQLQVEGGWNNGTVGLFAAGNFFLEDGWRQNSPSKVNQLFTKASYRGDKLDLNLSTLLVQTDLTGNGLLPSQMYDQDRSSVYSSPDTTKNRLGQFQLSGSYFVNDSFTVTGQIYRRNSKRHQKGADVMTGYDPGMVARRRPNPGEEYTCLLSSTNQYGYKIPDYYLIPINQTAGEDFFNGPVNPGDPESVIYSFYQEYLSTGNITSSKFDQYLNAPLTTKDGLQGTPLTPDYVSIYEQTFNFWRSFYESNNYNKGNVLPQIPTYTDPSGNLVNLYGAGGSSFSSWLMQAISGQNIIDPSLTDLYFYTVDSNNNVIKNLVVLKTPTNLDNCRATQLTNGVQAGSVPGGHAYTYKDANGNVVFVDGAGGVDSVTGRGQPGVVEGTPTALITDNQIDQLVDGGSIQFNWNLEHHKLMIGASIDAASADYTNSQQLGFLDANRNAYLDPEQANPMFGGALVSLANNNFSGTNTTKSLYFSETWSPVDTWHFTASGRYNQTHTKNKIAARSGINAFEIGDLINVPDDYNICDGDCQSSKPETNYRLPRLVNTLDPAETEKFSFYSFNPSLGATWQATERLNVYANWAQGTRTPSVIELGCAFDKTPIQTGLKDTNGDGIGDTPIYTPKSIFENRQCTLPTTLSGDPYLPQIHATTYDLGIRGAWGQHAQWNLGVFQTDLRDDIYFVAVGNGRGFFDSIGNTRRRGIEAGLSGKVDRWGFGVNYALTDATFQDSFRMMSPDNSSSVDLNDGYGPTIEVKPGDKMPGVSLHNLNATVNYAFTDKWTVGLTAVAHSFSYVRGNENNQHKVGVVQNRGLGAAGNALRQPTSNPGFVPGYAVLNFQTSYKISKEWTATMLVNNLLDKEYFTAGRLGRNPFSPSIDGAIGPDGYNHNSNDWLSTNFIAPGAPRGVWFSLNWHFTPD